jgi:hypothetical protein
MVPRTFPSTVNSTTGRRQMVVFFLSSATGLQRWKDYIPVKFVLDDTPTEASYNNDGYIAIDELSSNSGKQEWLDYIPVFLDNSATDAWEVNSNGFIQVGTSGFGGVPNSLFASGEQGAWYDPSDSTTLFQDQSGTTPVTAVEQPVSLMLDKSKGLVLGPELVTNGGPFVNTTGWSAGAGVSVSTSGNNLIVTTTAGSTSFPAGLFSFATEVGKLYRFTAVWRAGASGYPARLNARRTSSSSYGINIANSTTSFVTSTFYVFAATTSTAIEFYEGNSTAVGGTIEVQSVTVKELAGNHAYTPSTATASRPVLSSRYNLLTKTEQFDDAAWTKLNASVSANVTATTDPIGGSTADKIVENTATGQHGLGQTFNVVTGVDYIYTAYAKAAERSVFRFIRNTTSVPVHAPVFNLQTGVASGTGSPTITSAGDGWYKCSFLFTATATASAGYDLIMYPTGTNDYTGDGTSGMFIWGADLRVANDGIGIPYQRVNTSTDYDSDPAKFPRYLRFDGSDDYMLTNSVDFTGTDKMTVWAGVRKLSDATFQSIVCQRDILADNGSFGFFASPISGGNRFSWGSDYRGTVQRVATQARTYTAPTTAVFTSSMDASKSTSTEQIINRINAAAPSSVVVAQGPTTAGNLSNARLVIGAFEGVSLSSYLNGRLFSLIIRGAESTTPQIEQTETYVNQKTRAF